MQSLNVTINIPPDVVCVPKKEWERMVRIVEDRVVWWTMEDLMRKTQRGRSWIKKYMIDDPLIRQEIDSFTQFPKGGSGEYRFLISKMDRYLEERFDFIKERAECDI